MYGMGLGLTRPTYGSGGAPAPSWFNQAPWLGPDSAKSMLAADFANDRFAIPNLGSELLTNGAFPSDLTGWTTAVGVGVGSATWTAGRAVIVRTSGNSYGLYQAVATEPGKMYRAACTAKCTAGTPTARIVSHVTVNITSTTWGIAGTTTATVDTTIEHYFIAADTTTYLYIEVITGAGTVEFDDVTCKAVAVDDIGAELVTDPELDTGTDWTTSVAGGTSTSVISGGVVTLTGDGTNEARADTSVTTEVGAQYAMCIRNDGGGTAGIRIGTTSGGSEIWGGGATSVQGNTYTQQVFTATATTTYFRLYRATAGAAAVGMLRVRKLTPNVSLKTATAAEVYTFTCSSTTARTYMNASGVMKNDLAVDALRYCYRNGTRMLLLEFGRTNSAYNTGITAAAGVSVAASPATDLMGGTGATRMTGNGTANDCSCVDGNTAVSYTSGTNYAFSVFVKVVSGTPIIQASAPPTAFGNNAWVTFDTSDNTVTQGPAAAADVFNYGNGWWRIGFNAAATATTTADAGAVGFVAARVATSRSSHTSTDVIDVWGFQCEAGFTVTSYIPTSGAPVARAIETFQWSNFVLGLIQRIGVSYHLQKQRAAFHNQTNTGSHRWLGGGGTIVGYLMRGAGANQGRTYNGSTSVTITPSGSIVTPNTSKFRIAASADVAGIAGSVNGGAVATNAAQQATRTAGLYLARHITAPTDDLYGQGYYEQCALWPKKYITTELQTLSTVV